MQIPLTVYANPYATPLDHNGRAQCVVYRLGSSNPIGARFDHEAHERSKAETVSGEGEHRFVFTGEKVTLVCSNMAELAFYAARAKDGASLKETRVKGEGGRELVRVELEVPGALVAADEQTARKFGLPFLEPEKALAAAKAKAIADFKAAYGFTPDAKTDYSPEKDEEAPAAPAANPQSDADAHAASDKE